MKEAIKKTIISIMAILILLSGFAMPSTNYVYADESNNSATQLKEKEESAMEKA